MELFHFLLMRMRKTLQLKKLLLRNSYEIFDTEIVKKLEKVPVLWLKEHSCKLLFLLIRS